MCDALAGVELDRLTLLPLLHLYLVTVRNCGAEERANWPRKVVPSTPAGNILPRKLDLNVSF